MPLPLLSIALFKRLISGASLVLLGGWAAPAAAQAPQSGFPASLRDGLKTYLSPDSSTYLKLNFVSQIWLRYNESNPGTTVNGELAPSTGDVGLRRVRLVLSGQLTPRVFMFVQFGQNSFSYLSPRKAGAFFHDVTTDYAVIKRALSLGVGLNGWNGPSRFANTGVTNILTLDVPLFQEATNDVNDQQVRRLGVYAKGKLGRLDYRVSVGKPFVTQTAAAAPEPISAYSTYSPRKPHAATNAYLMYQFLDQEGNLGAGTVGTYLGRKRVLNLGAGLVSQAQAVWHTIATGDTVTQAIRLYAIDVYYDAPLNAATGTAISAYGGYFHYDFGPGYLKNSGPMNPANGVRAGAGALNGPGNNYPMLGTGHVWYAQAGYLLKRDLLGEYGTLQPQGSVQWARYDRLADPMVLLNVGVNWLLSGNNSKVTLNYQSRPVFTAAAAGQPQATARLGEYVFQYQVAF